MTEKITISINPDDLGDISKGKELEFERLIDDGATKLTIVVKGKSNQLKHSCNSCHPK
jgi:hypothetical protein